MTQTTDLIHHHHRQPEKPWTRSRYSSNKNAEHPNHARAHVQTPPAPKFDAISDALIALVVRLALLGPVTSTAQVAMYGGSAGGHTALSLAGGEWSPARFRDHCQAHIAEDFSSCVGFITRLRGNWLDGVKKQVALAVIRYRFGDNTAYSHQDPRIRAIIAAVPFAADFDLSTLAAPRVPLGLILARQDINQIPHFHGLAVQRICKTCTTVADLPQAGHGVMLSPLPPLGATNSIAFQLLSDPPGFERKQLPALHQKVADFFKQHLTRP